MSTTNVSAQMRAAVGSVLGRQVSYPVTDSDIRRWACAVYWPEPPPPLFWDADHAAGSALGGIVAPEDFNPFAWMVAERSGAETGDVNGADDVDPNDPDRTEQLLAIPGPGLAFQLNGGIDTEYEARIRPGDVVTSVNRLASYREREGRLGLMLFTVTEDTWTNQAGAVIKRARNTLIRY